MGKFKLVFGVFSLLILTACAQKDLPDSPETILQKSLTEGPKVYKTEMTMGVQVKSPANNFRVSEDYSIHQRMNFFDPKKPQSEASFAIMEEMTDPELGLLSFKAEAQMKAIAEDYYVGYKKFDMTGDFSEVPQIQTILKTLIKPYLNDSFHLSLKDIHSFLETSAKALEAYADTKIDLKNLKKYNRESLMKDLAEAKVLISAKDYGVEDLKTLSGKTVSVHHYAVAIDPQGLKTFIKTLNDRFHFIKPEKLEDMLKNGFQSEKGEFLKIEDMVTILNQILKVEEWIGQKDYLPYKVTAEITKDSFKLVWPKIEALVKPEPSDQEEANKFFDEGTLDYHVIAQSEPIEAFNVEKPKANIIEISPFIQLMIAEIEKQLPTPNELYYKKLNDLDERAYNAYFNYDDDMYGYADSVVEYLADPKNTTNPKDEIEASKKVSDEVMVNLKSVQKELNEMGSLEGDKTLRDIFLEEVESYIKKLETSNKEKTEIWLKMLTAQIPSAEGEEKVNNIIHADYEVEMKLYEKTEAVREAFIKKHAIDVSKSF